MMSGQPPQNQLPQEYGEAATASTRATTAAVNTSNNFWLIVGVDVHTAMVADGDLIAVRNQAGQVVSSTTLTHIGTAASELQTVFVMMIIPPGGCLTTSNPSHCQFIVFPNLQSMRGWLW